MEAAERFEELKAQKEMRQLQEEKKNDKKPPPYKHIKSLCCRHGKVRDLRSVVVAMDNWKC